ncbi:MAG: hypothetical protein IMF08_09575 [Proteobacteria bacterium]|nr:hypothetical protein [Pseudomonadota bacterium]
MARLDDMIPPGEAIRWEAFSKGSQMEIAVTDRHIIWADGIFKRDKGKAALADIRFVDLEEGGNSVNLHCDGAIYRIEEFEPGKLEELARAIGRPARIWRECKTPAAVLARRWRQYLGAGAVGLYAAGLFGLAFLVLGGDELTKFGDALTKLDVAIATVVICLAGYFIVEIAKNTLPHMLIGRTLTGEKRRDFVGWITDPRWQGVKTDDGRLPRSRLGEWAMRKAYGEIPDIGEREPEILIPGNFSLNVATPPITPF